MSTLKSFAKGSAFPPLSRGVLRLYSMRFCPYAQRTRLVLAHKEIPFETVNVDLKEKPEWFFEKNPLGLVPVLEQDDKIVYESLITCDYLDDVYPKNRLTPADPYRKARDTMLIDFFGNKFTSNFIKSLRSEGQDKEAVENLRAALEKLEKEVTARGVFFGGEKPAMIDLMIWPWFERLGWIEISSLKPSASTFPKLYAWTQTMLQQPAVKATFIDQETQLAFAKSYKAGKPDYDVGLEP